MITNYCNRLRAQINLVLAVVALTGFPVLAATFTVSNTNITGPGSLEQAIFDANTSPGADNIRFEIAAPGVQTLSPLSELPTITDPVTIDGYSQPGAAPNTLGSGQNAIILIRLLGSSAGSADGLRIAVGDCTVRGLSIGGFAGDAIEVSAGTSNRIQGCYLGLDPDGTTSLGNAGNGVLVTGTARRTLIGGEEAADRCVISASDRGVMVSSGVTGCAILGNHIYSNSGLGIDLNMDGFSANDVADADSGANDLQNFPVLTSVAIFPTETVIEGTLSSLANQDYRIEFFNNAAASGFGAGQTYLGFTNVTTDAGGNAFFAFTVLSALVSDQAVTATATAITTANNTSEFSTRLTATPFDTVNLTVALTGVPDHVTLSTNISYSITVTNNGPADATSVIVTDVLPANLSFLSATPSRGTATISDGILTCDLGSLPNQGIAIITVTGIATTSGTLSNFVSVTSTEAENLPSDNSAVAFTTAGLADLSVSRAAYPAPVAAGRILTNIITITNRGPDPATSVALSHFVNFTMVLTGVSASQGTINASGGTVTAQLGTLAAGQAATVTVLAVPTVSGTIFESGSISGLESDPITDNNSFNNSVTVTGGSGVIQFSQFGSSISESGGVLVVPVQRGGGAAGTVTVDFAAISGTATAGSDFIATNGTLTFAEGELIQYLTVPIIDDSVLECNEAFTLALSNPTGGVVLVGNTNITVQIFDNETTNSGTIALASAANPNLPPGTSFGTSERPVISYDGRYVAFESASTGMVTNTFDQAGDDVFVFDFQTRAVSLVSVSASGTRAGNSTSDQPVISRAGRHVMFKSTASDLVPDDTNDSEDVFVRDLDVGVTALVSGPTGGGVGNDASTYSTFSASLLSSNGNVAVFESAASNLATNDSNGSMTDVFAHDLAAGTTVLVSVDAAGTGSGNAVSERPAVSGDGRYVVFQSAADNLTGLPDFNSDVDLFRRDLWSNTTEVVSVNLAGSATGDQGSDTALVSHDGRYVAFQSFAGDLTPNGATDVEQVYLRDMTFGTNVLVSVDTNGLSANNTSHLVALSPDGRFVLFESLASNLVANDANEANDLFVRDLVAGTTVAVNRSINGALNSNAGVTGRGISDDGRYVVFETSAPDLVANDSNAAQDVFVRDLLTETTVLLACETSGRDSGNNFSFEPVLSGNGSVVAFTSYASDLAARDVNFDYDVFVRDLLTTSNVLASAAFGASANEYSFNPVISADGTRLVFASYANNLTPELNAFTEANIFVRHLDAQTTTLVSVSTDGTLADNYCELPQISADNRFVLFFSYAKNLVSAAVTGDGDYFLRDLLAGTTLLVGPASNGSGAANAGTYDAKLSPDGRFIVFESPASNVAANDSNGSTYDIFIRDRTRGTAELVSLNAAGTGSANGDSHHPMASDDGRFVAFESSATDFGSTDANGLSDVYVRDRSGGSNLLVSVNLAGTGSGNGGSRDALISANGRYVVFYSEASDLVANDNNNAGDVFIRDLLLNTTALVSVKSEGSGSANGSAYHPSMTPDGRYVVFESNASDLVPNDLNGTQTDLFRRDVLAGITTLISVNCPGTGTGNNHSYFRDHEYQNLTADGRYVSFHSDASDLVSGQYPSQDNIFRRDLLTGTTVLVSQNRFANGSGSAGSWEATISRNGGVIGFASSAPDLTALDLNQTDDVFTWTPIAVVALPDLTLNMSASAASVVQGDSFIYTLTVLNNSSAVATGVILQDLLPSAVNFVSAATSQGSVFVSGGTVTADIGSLGIGAVASITLTVTATSVVAITNTATASSSTADPTPADNIGSAIVLVTPFTPPPPPPVLSMRSLNRQVILSWPSSTPAAFTVETTTNLKSPVIWTPATNSISDNGTNRSITITPDPAEPRRYYRLKN